MDDLDAEKLTLNMIGGKLLDVEKGETVAPQRLLEFSTPRTRIIEAADAAIQYDLQNYPKAMSAYKALVSNPEALAHWDVSNYITMRKLGYNDHGRVHAWVTGAASMAILELLIEGGVRPDIQESGIGDVDDAFLIVILGTMLHDIGNSVHRVAHEQYSAILALQMLDQILPPIYPDQFKRTKIRAFILHCINSHDLNPPPLTIEGGITALADGTDITKGRGRKAFALGSVDIHSISALAVDQVTISKGSQKPVEIEVSMNNSTGIFQVEEILAPKVIRTPMSKYVSLIATTKNPEDRILHKVRLAGHHFVNDHHED